MNNCRFVKGSKSSLKHPVLYTRPWHKLDRGQNRMDRVKNSDEIKERQEGISMESSGEIYEEE